MLEARDEKLKVRRERVEAIHVWLEPKITGTGIELKQVRKYSDIASLPSDIADLHGKMAKQIDLYASHVDVAALYGRVVALPMWSMPVPAMLATSGAGKSIAFTLERFTRP